jgi:hypothetical protein
MECLTKMGNQTNHKKQWEISELELISLLVFRSRDLLNPTLRKVIKSGRKGDGPATGSVLTGRCFISSRRP